MTNRKLKLAIFLFTLPVLAPFETARASQPAPWKSVAERVDLSSDVLVGTITKVRAVQITRIDETSREAGYEIRGMNPQPDHISPSAECLEFEVEVSENLYPAGTNEPHKIYVLLRGGFFGVGKVDKDNPSKPQIFLIRLEYDRFWEKGVGERKYFSPSYDCYLDDKLQQKPEVIAAVDARLKREKEQQMKMDEEKPANH